MYTKMKSMAEIGVQKLEVRKASLDENFTFHNTLKLCKTDTFAHCKQAQTKKPRPAL